MWEVENVQQFDGRVVGGGGNPRGRVRDAIEPVPIAFSSKHLR